MNWYCISAVPLKSFHNSSPDITYMGLLAFLLGMIMVLDFLYLYSLNHRLKISVTQANAASVAKTDFLSRMSHDIRTPINVISGTVELALLEKNPEQTVEYLENIQSSGKFLLGLVNDVLDMNKVESGNMELHLEPYSSREFMTYINAVIRPLCEEKKIHFIAEGGNIGALVVMLDPLRFNQIFFNLLSNAVKFTPENGHIRITGNKTELLDGRVQLDVTVSDDGMGMSEEFQKTMFDMFSQENRTKCLNGAGSGLGLAIVKKLIDLMGGTIRVKSALGEGTTFYIQIVSQKGEQKEKTPEEELTPGSLGGKRILLCEDHPINAKIIVKMMDIQGVSVEVAENGQIGVEKFETSTEGYYDAILMDIRMPIMNGIEATRAIRSLRVRKDARKIPIIALTANAYDTDVSACIEAGMNEHMAKPVEMNTLYQTLLQLINKNEDD